MSAYRRHTLQAIQEPEAPPSTFAAHCHCPLCGSAAPSLWEPTIGTGTYVLGSALCWRCAQGRLVTGIVLREVRP